MPRLSRRTFLQLSAAAGAAGLVALNRPRLAFLQPIPDIPNPLAFYPQRDWEKVYRDQYRYDSSFTFICAPNDTHNCRLRAFVRNGVIMRMEQNYDAEKVSDVYRNRVSGSC